MPSFISSSNAPLARFLPPLLLGICVGEIYCEWWLIYATLIVSVILFIASLFLQTPKLRYKYRHLFGVSVLFLFFGIGLGAIQMEQRGSTPPSAKEHPYFSAQLTQQIEEGDHSIRVTAKVLYLFDREGQEMASSEQIILYFQPDRKSRLLQKGDLLLCKNHLTPIENTPNPDSFDYATYMRRCGYHLSQFVDNDSWRVVGNHSDSNLTHKAQGWREVAQSMLHQAQLSPPNEAILESLLLGYTENLTQEQRSSFSTAGISHILAVSGLHTGIVLLIVFVLLYPLKLFRASAAQLSISVVVLWLYATLTGLTPSVVRACIMATCLLMGEIFGRKSSPLNALCLAAILMLVYGANNLFLIGFQLSFAATLSILLFQPKIFDLIPLKNPLLRYLWSLSSLTVAAQIGVLPIALYYFHELPMLLFITNIIVVPLLPFVMILGGILLLFEAFGSHPTVIVTLLNRLLGWLNKGTQQIAQWEYGSLNNIYLAPHYLAIYLGVLLLIVGYLQSRKGGYLTAIQLFIIGSLTVIWLFVPNRPLERGMVVYYNTHQSYLQFVEGRENYMLLLDSLPDMEEIERSSYNFRLKNRLNESRYVRDSVESQQLFIELPYIQYGNKRIAIANSRHWSELTTATPLKVDYCIVTKGYAGGLKTLKRHFDFKTLIIAANFNHFAARYLIQDCQREGVECYNIRDKGAWMGCF